VVALAHTHIFVNDGYFAVIPFLREKSDVFNVSDGIGHMRNSLRDVDTIARTDIEKLLFSIVIMRHDDTIAFREQIVFIELRVIVVAAYLPLVDELKIEFDDRLIGIERKDAASSIADGIEIALRGQSLDFHYASVVFRLVGGKGVRCRYFPCFSLKNGYFLLKMLKVRLIPILLLKDGRMVKPIQFGSGGERDVGSPVTTAIVYNSQDADELIFIDINPPQEGHAYLSSVLRDVAAKCFVPLTAGGNIRTIDDITLILQSGADKISINRAALERPEFITEVANRFGSSCTVVSIDAKKVGDRYEVFRERGQVPTGRELVAWAKEVAERGAGEILLTSIEREGTMKGYDIDMIKSVTDAVGVPVIANGGVGTREHFVEAVKLANASGLGASSVFHFSDSNLTQVKSFLIGRGIEMRPI